MSFIGRRAHRTLRFSVLDNLLRSHRQRRGQFPIRLGVNIPLPGLQFNLVLRSGLSRAEKDCPDEQPGETAMKVRPTVTAGALFAASASASNDIGFDNVVIGLQVLRR